MKLDRRNFIKFTAGGIAGIHMTPLPFKLMDDVAIWTQNWPWVPVPPDGEFSHEKTVCNLCQGGCGIEVRKIDERAVKIEGRTDYPVNPGGICPLGMGGLQLLYNRDARYTSPMRRIGEKGSGKFIPVSWREALHELTVRLSYLRSAGKPETLVSVDGNRTGTTMSAMIERFTSAIGSPNYVRVPTLEDTYSMGTFLMQGTEMPMAYDLENSDFILSFGSGLLEGWGAPGRMMNAWRIIREKALEGNAKVVQVESRASNTASKADQWVTPRPGTDGALALGLAHVIIKNNWYNTQFINGESFGFNDWKSNDGKNRMGFKKMVLDQYSPERVADITGVKADQITSLAKSFSSANAPVAVYGKGKGILNGGLYEFMAVHSLNAMVGNFNKPGGILLPDALPLSSLPDIKPDAIALKGLKTARLDRAGTKEFPFAKSLINNLSETVLKGHTSPIDTLMIFSSNPAYTLPDNGIFREVLEKIPFVVSFSPFKDETSYMADLILPDHTYLEKIDDVIWPTGLQYPLYGLSNPVVKPVYDTRNSGDVIIQIAKKMGKAVNSDFPWDNFEEVLKTRAKGLFDAGGGLVASYDGVPAWKWQKQESIPEPDYDSFDDMWGKIKSGGFWYKPICFSNKRESLFKTPTNKFEFYCNKINRAFNEYSKETFEKRALENMGIGVEGDEISMPHYEEVSFPGRRSKYKLKMMPYDQINLASGWVPSAPFQYKTILDNQLLKNESFATINPKTASEYELEQGDSVLVQSIKGTLQVRVDLSEGAMPGIVYLPTGFGHTAYDEFIRGKGVNPNDIIQARKDPLSGHPLWWDTPVKISKV